MNTQLIFEILELAVSLAKAQFDGNGQQHPEIEQTLLDIVQTGIEAYQQHTGEPIDASLIKTEAEI
jgi:hypothetical protein